MAAAKSPQPRQLREDGRVVHDSAKEQIQPPETLIIHIDVDNSFVVNTRWALDKLSAEDGSLQATSAASSASQILAEASWGTIDHESGDWAPGLPSSDQAVDSCISFADYLRAFLKDQRNEICEVDKTLIEKLHHFGEVKETSKKQRRRSSSGATSSGPGAAAAAVVNAYKQLLHKMLLPPSVCFAIGIECPDSNTVLGEVAVDAKVQQGGGDQGYAVPTAIPDSSPNSTNLSQDLPPQLGCGFWHLSPTVLHFLFTLARSRRPFRVVLHSRHAPNSKALRAVTEEFNALCEGKHPAFNGENKTKQVLLDGRHKTPDLRLTPESFAVLHPAEMTDVEDGEETEGGADTENEEGNQGRGSARLKLSASGRVYVGAREIYAGIVFRELAERKIIMISHCSVQSNPQRDDSTDLSFCSLSKGGITAPLPVWVDVQDTRHLHFCLAATGIPTAWHGFCYPETLKLIDVVTDQPIVLQAADWESHSDQVQQLASAGTATRKALKLQLHPPSLPKGKLGCHQAACRVSLSPWECLTNPNSILEALDHCDELRKQSPLLLTCDESGAVNNPTEELEGFKAMRNHEDGGAELDNGVSSVLDMLFGSSPQSGKCLTPSEYLNKEIVPVLQPALEILLRDRPADPVPHLAFYLLRHCDGYNRLFMPNPGEATQHNGV